MSVCCPTCGAPAPSPTQPARNSIQLKPGARPLSSLVTSPDARFELNSARETDAHTALARGLAEYLSQQVIEVGGRKLQLTAYTTWAEPEDAVRYPAVAVGAGTGAYDRSFTPVYEKTIDGTVRLLRFSEFAQELQLDLWATDPRERSYLMAMLEEALNPVDWMYGMRLALPFYHNATATYELVSSEYVDSSDEAMAKYRRAQIVVRGNLTVYRLLNFPTAKPRLDLDAVNTRLELDDMDLTVVLPLNN